MNPADRGDRALACQTLRFYDSNAQLYADKTRAIDLAHLYKPFLESIPNSGRILDVGCGAGRDLKHFADIGFEAVGIDPSEKLAAMASEFSGCKVLVSSIQDFRVDREFDGAWACASLIHLPRHQLISALGKISLALRQRGVLFASMKVGIGETVMDDGRFVTRYSPEELSDAIKKANFEIINVWVTPDSFPGRNSVVWVNVIARKSSES